MKLFKDRTSAGKLLAGKLKDVKADLVLGIPRGGIVVAAEVAKSLKFPLDIVVVRKIGAPNQPELALGAIDPDGEMVWNEEAVREAGEVGEIIENEWKELKRREDVYRNGKHPIEVDRKTVILVDDGMATGETALAACKYLKRHGAKVILALPVASSDALEKMTSEVDKVVVLETPEAFRAVGQFYEEFEPVSDETVVQLLS